MKGGKKRGKELRRQSVTHAEGQVQAHGPEPQLRRKKKVRRSLRQKEKNLVLYQAKISTEKKKKKHKKKITLPARREIEKDQ